ncbi:MAG: hypothetical protein ABFD07_16570 [Methanobacterium sp.]
MKVCIDKAPVGVVETINIKEAEIPQSHDNRLINLSNCEISGTLPHSKEVDELISKLNKIAEEEFQKHKIKKVDYFKDPSKAPSWLEDEFQICEIMESKVLPKGIQVMYPWEIYQDKIIKYGTALIEERDFDMSYKRVLLIVGIGD